MKYCDLHTHTAYSDGSFTPAELVAKAKELDLVIAVTDHNTVAGLPDALREAEKQGVTVVPGIELSTVYNGTELHLLGLFIHSAHYGTITQLMKEYHELKEQSNIDLVRRLNDAGYHIDYSRIKQRNITHSINRAHIAAELWERGYVSSVREAFTELLSEEKGYYAPPKRLLTLDAIAFLRQIGAVPVLAHPMQDMDITALRGLLPFAKEAGLLGIETMHSSYSMEQIRLASRIAEEFGLYPSGGSDFHGSNKPDVFLGVGRGNLAIPTEIYEQLKSLQ